MIEPNHIMLSKEPELFANPMLDIQRKDMGKSIYQRDVWKKKIYNIYYYTL